MGTWKRRRNAALIVGVLTLEVAVVAMFSVRRPAASPRSGAATQSDGDENAPPPESELLLGEFSVAGVHGRDPLGSSERVELKVFAVVAESDRAHYELVHQRKRYRIEDAVAAVLRSAGPQDLADAELTSLKAAIKSAVNQCAGEPLLVGVAIPDYEWRRK